MTPEIARVMFVVLGAMSVGSAVAVVAGRNLFRNILFFGVFLLTIAGFFFLLEADFVALVQIFVYAGGVVVMLLFGIMLTSRITDQTVRQTNEQQGFALVSAALLAALLVAVLLTTQFPEGSGAAPATTTALIGKLFLTDYLLPFELISVLLLAALVGALVGARGDEPK